MKHNYLILFICFALLFSACSNSNESKTTDNTLVNKEFLSKIRTVNATIGNQQEEMTLTGKVEADPDKEIRFVPLISGVIDRVHFSLGDKVQKGQTLIDLRSTELSALQSELASLETEVKIAERELQTSQTMFDDNMLSERELLETKGKLTQAQAALNKVKTDISIYGSDKGNGVFSVKAPISGYITYKNASSGSTVSADGDPLFTIVDLNTVWISVNVYASDLLFVNEGMEAKITTLSYPGEVFTGKIDKLSQVFDPEEKVLKARIILPNKDLKFKPEMSVVVKLKNEIHNQSVAIPSDALIFDDNNYFVIIENQEEDFEVREVNIKGHNNKTTYIESGLSEGENIVVRNHLLIYSELKGL